ncbi:MAG: GerMN domain-containing protein [Treponema sp.]|nr:GerMN domain-containing protein [Treponema sp.]
MAVFFIFLLFMFLIVLYFFRPKDALDESASQKKIPGIQMPWPEILPPENPPLENILEQEQPQPIVEPPSEQNLQPDSLTVSETVVEEEMPQEENNPQIRSRSIYFMHSENNGDEIQPAKVIRNFDNFNSPLTDSINVLLSGPTNEEAGRGIMSFIPKNSKLLSARVTNNTAYLSFNEEFRYNTFGREGCAAQIKQIVLTATEFPTVEKVQFLIEGEIVNFLSEGVMIRDPIGR